MNKIKGKEVKKMTKRNRNKVEVEINKEVGKVGWKVFEGEWMGRGKGREGKYDEMLKEVYGGKMVEVEVGEEKDPFVLIGSLRWRYKRLGFGKVNICRKVEGKLILKKAE